MVAGGVRMPALLRLDTRLKSGAADRLPPGADQLSPLLPFGGPGRVEIFGCAGQRAGRGIGRGIALGLAAAGADVRVNDREAAEAVAEEVRKQALPTAQVFDLIDHSAVRGGLEAAAAEMGRPIDILVNNAGIGDFVSFADIPAPSGMPCWTRL
jgi:hypothetical protein